LAVGIQESSFFRYIDQIAPLSYRFAVLIQALSWRGIGYGKPGMANLAWLAARSGAEIHYFYDIFVTLT